MGPRLGLAVVVVIAFAVGCVAGEPRYFDDRTAEVRTLRVNAYQDVEKDEAVIEVRGLGADGVERAFQGSLRLGLDRQDRSTEPHEYVTYKSWRDDVDADDFSSPNVPTYVLRVPAEDMARATTYRAWASATLGDAVLTADPALFDWTG